MFHIETVARATLTDANADSTQTKGRNRGLFQNPTFP